MVENKLATDGLNQFNQLCFLDKLRFWFKREKKKNCEVFQSHVQMPKVVEVASWVIYKNETAKW